MKPFSRSWVKVNQKTWRNTESGFIICNESYQGLNGRRQKVYAVYLCARAQDGGEVMAVKSSYHQARAFANNVFDKLRSQASGR